MSGAWQEFEAHSRDASRRLLVLGAVLAVAVLAALRPTKAVTGVETPAIGCGPEGISST